jgi:hypothetical protein
MNDIRKIFGQVNDHDEIDFSLREHTQEDMFGSEVIVCWKLFNGETLNESMPIALAVDTVLRNPLNGLIYKSAHIEFMGCFDDYGQSI